MTVDMMLSLAVPVTLCVIIIVLLYIYGTWTHSTWSSLGIPGPKPVPFMGNAADFRTKGRYAATHEWCQKYGKVFGVYILRNPVLMTTDLDILKEVFIKDFQNFSRRGLIPRLQRYPVKASLPFVQGDTWRRQRHTLTPTFSSSKLKLMSGFISRCCRNLSAAFDGLAIEGKPVDIRKLFSAFTLDAIAGTGFGFETNSLTEIDNDFLQTVSRLISNFANRSVLPELTAGIFPALAPVLLAAGFRRVPDEMKFVTHTIETLIEERRQEKNKGRVDFIQLMLDAEASEEEVRANPEDKHMTKAEIVAEGVVFFLAGFDTTSTTLQFLAYLLALHPETQETLHRQVIEAVGDTEPSYESVANIRYLDCCIYEALRMYPPAFMTGRTAKETRIIKGITIPAGCEVVVPIYGLMRDEELFPNADKFIPERFMDEAHPIPSLVKEMAFGAGPRQCIGMRLALLEIRMAVVALVRSVRFTKIPQTIDPSQMTFLKNAAIATPTIPILIGAEQRQK